ncbi:hypothetical protein [Stutzerimonas xanthomarina]
MLQYSTYAVISPEGCARFSGAPLRRRRSGRSHGCDG